MARFIDGPVRLQAHGEPAKSIEEFVGRLNTSTAGVSIARMVSPQGWAEPGQTPEFDEYTVVLREALTVETRERTFRVTAGQAVVAERGQWVRYSTPDAGGAEYLAVCIPAFSPASVHRDAE